MIDFSQGTLAAIFFASWAAFMIRQLAYMFGLAGQKDVVKFREIQIFLLLLAFTAMAIIFLISKFSDQHF